jgi:adenylylsulfate kinase
MVWWITGLSGAGKSTVSRLVRDGLSARGCAALLLDGDVMRFILDETAAHTPDDRCRLGMTYARLARELASQGPDVVCATISMFHVVREWNRAHIPRYREIYLRVPLSELEVRDPHGLYVRARGGGDDNVVGVDAPFEEPLCPDLVIDNFAGVDPPAAAALILALEAP